jgi:anti-sigma regulatory factor (Ser/Thr protein kinase)
MVLAASEAVTNAIEHGSADHASVVVELTVAIDRAHLSVTDAGRPGARCPLLDAAPTPPPPSSVRGRGLVIMFGLADGLDVEPVGSGTRVSMEFRRDSCAV